MILESSKLVYLAARTVFKIFLGKKNRDDLWLKNDFNFPNFLYRATSITGIKKYITLSLNVPKYNYKICCPLNREDFIIVTRHEEEIIDRFEPKVGDCVIDVGAHLGRYTIVSSKKVGSEGKVIALEPHPFNFKLLKKSIKENNLTNVVTENVAASSAPGKLQLYLPDQDLGYTMHHSIKAEYLNHKYGRASTKFIKVNSNTIDNIVQTYSLSQVNWMKIDVEGAELDVLRGAETTLSCNKNMSVLIEVHTESNFKAITGLLKKYNFDIIFEKSYNKHETHIIAQKRLEPYAPFE